ncbi:hypothetical protein RP20_CCG025837 [Aedes albopictus]|nr:hypothetical protein RP20_CCG025837 [Aedes albopictus]
MKRILAIVITLLVISSSLAFPASSESPCPAKHPDCYQVPVREQTGIQMMMLGIWRAGPKKGPSADDADVWQNPMGRMVIGSSSSLSLMSL